MAIHRNPLSGAEWRFTGEFDRYRSLLVLLDEELHSRLQERRETLEEAFDSTQEVDVQIELDFILDFTHFKRHKRGNLQYDGTEWRGVSVHRSWRSIVKNPPTPTTSGYAQR